MVFIQSAFKSGTIFQKTELKSNFSTVLYFHLYSSSYKSVPSNGCLLLARVPGPALKSMRIRELKRGRGCFGQLIIIGYGQLAITVVALGIITCQNPKLHFRRDYFKEQKQLQWCVAGSAFQSDAIQFYLAVAVCLGITVHIHVQVKKPKYLEKNTAI